MQNVIAKFIKNTYKNYRPLSQISKIEKEKKIFTVLKHEKGQKQLLKSTLSTTILFLLIII